MIRDSRMPAATICILRCNIIVSMFTAMLALRAIRAVLVILGLMALAPAQAAGAAATGEATLRNCDLCTTAVSKDQRAALVPGAGAASQPGVHTGPDDGCSMGLQDFPPVSRLSAGQLREAGADSHESTAAARLDRPPKRG